MALGLVVAAAAVVAAGAAEAATVPYVPYPLGMLPSDFAWSGSGPIGSIGGVPDDTVWMVGAPVGASYRTVGGFIEAPGLSNWVVLLNGTSLTPFDNGAADGGATVYRYFYAADVALVAGANTVSIEITTDGSGGAGGTGRLFFANDETALPIPLPASGMMLLTAIAAALGRRRVG